MRKLLVLRGAPGAGKTTWTNENRLLIYTLSFDNLKMLYQSPIQTIYGKEAISPRKSDLTDELLLSVLEERMKSGEFTIIDAINSKSKTISMYQALAIKYRYEVFLVDFSDIPIEKAKERNINRSRRKQVRECIIDSVYLDFKEEKLPHNIQVIKPDELNKVFEKPMDLSNYKKVHHIGDIHACYDILVEAVRANGNLREDEFYIFLGDYTDKGTKNLETLKLLLSLKNKKNIILCEGNHEKYIWNWANNENYYSSEFEEYTLPQLKGLDKKEIRKLYRTLKDCFWYNYHGKSVINTHGGIATMPNQIDLISTQQLIHGVGYYFDLACIANTFGESTDLNTYQVFGHRNPDFLDIDSKKRTFFLEGGVDMGGDLRWLTLTKNGFEPKTYKNSEYRLK